MAYNGYNDNNGYRGNQQQRGGNDRSSWNGRPQNYGKNNDGRNNQSNWTEPVQLPAKLDKMTYVDQAEKVIKSINKGDLLTSNQIRIILDLVNEVYLPVKTSQEKELGADVRSKLKYIKMKIAYQAGKESGKIKPVKIFVEKSGIMKYIDSVYSSDAKEDLTILAHYMEALVAYHKYYGNN